MTRVIDGDTIVVEGIGTVRLIGVDTPETVDPDSPVEYYGKEASDFTRSIANRQMVTLGYDQDRIDRYGRTLAYVYLPDGTLLNAEIIRLGYGHAYTFFPFRLIEEFRALEREARAAGRGLWAPRGSSRGRTPLPAQPLTRALLQRTIDGEKAYGISISGGVLPSTRTFQTSAPVLPVM